MLYGEWYYKTIFGSVYYLHGFFLLCHVFLIQLFRLRLQCAPQVGQMKPIFRFRFFSIVFFLLVLHLVTVCGSRSLTFICNRLYVSSTVEKVTHFHWFARLLLMFLLFSSFISFNTLLGDSFSFISFFFLFTRAIPTLCIICTSTTDVGAWFFYFTILHTTT